MKKRYKTGTVAFATSSGFAVVHGPCGPASDDSPESAKPQLSPAKPASPQPVARESTKAS